MSAANKFQFSSFKTSFSSNVSALKRRFSSGDLESDAEEPPTLNYEQNTQPNKIPDEPLGGTSTGGQPGPGSGGQVGGSGGQVGGSGGQPGPVPRGTSAPTSPSRSASSSSIFQRLQSVTGVARDVTRDLTSQVLSSVQGSVVPLSKIPYKDPSTLILLVVDDSNTDWSKYFNGKKVNGLNIQTEQCEFSELSVISYEGITIASYVQSTLSNRQLRQFIPDFLLIRQNLRDAGRDYKSILLALMYGGVQSVNSLSAIYNFQDKPWVFAHMIGIQRRLAGFPLIEQNFYPDYRDMGTFIPKIPAVLKIGHAHGGLGKIRCNSNADYQDGSSVVAVTGTYCTSEAYIESRCDVHIQKIGTQYKAFMRKGIVGHWKSGSGSAMLEQIPLDTKYRTWVDNVANLFGGLDICALEVLIGKDGREWIIEVNDSALSLMGESQEEDRRHIAELVLSRMAAVCKAPIEKSSGGQVKYTQRRMSREEDKTGNNPEEPRRESIKSVGVSNKSYGRQNSEGQLDQGVGVEGEDTMKNLRKTFAGIFGDM